MLQPPNHKYVTVNATITAADNSGAAPAITLVSATSNEPDNAPGDADGNTTDDVVRVDLDTFRLRAERSESGTGRIYTITYRATDACGNRTTRSATVRVDPPALKPKSARCPARAGRLAYSAASRMATILS